MRPGVLRGRGSSSGSIRPFPRVWGESTPAALGESPPPRCRVVSTHGLNFTRARPFPVLHLCCGGSRLWACPVSSWDPSWSRRPPRRPACPSPPPNPRPTLRPRRPGPPERTIAEQVIIERRSGSTRSRPTCRRRKGTRRRHRQARGRRRPLAETERKLSEARAQHLDIRSRLQARARPSCTSARATVSAWRSSVNRVVDISAGNHYAESVAAVDNREIDRLEAVIADLEIERTQRETRDRQTWPTRRSKLVAQHGGARRRTSTRKQPRSTSSAACR